MEENALVIERIFEAPRELVWKAWTESELMQKWWGPEGFTSQSIKIDFRVGGMAILGMHGPAGSPWDRDMYSSGVYKEIVSPNDLPAGEAGKLVTTDYFSDSEGNMIEPSKEGQVPNFPKEMTVTVLFEEAGGGKTKLSVIYPKPETAEQLEAMLASGMKEGWNSSLNKLENLLKENS